MKKLFKPNLILVIITIMLYATVYLGMLFSIVLGFVQVAMSLFIAYHFKSLKLITKALFIFYIIPTIILLVLIAQEKYLNLNSVIEIIVLPMTLALLHLYITFRIKKENEL